MRNLIEFLVLHLVEHPEDVVVTEEEFDGLWQYTIEVHPDDRGQVIGRRGRTIDAIRTLARVRAMKEDKGVRVDIISDDDEIDEE
ncbi:KH domain-containing protein [Candidatus Woesebacteria bacterium]|nr:KH domain-containing protein [Candidatus Woesebacteria bacterium]MCD8507256.1 KH domain-containing protein [Candidatus Woesebacteria bacterium]MCD8526608.1 KH domain-containing protein [Candidatus Woesebacteria bacterium]MCD8546004.1 KH domain-containing protein [Candidatus Woesebacteria bacterium]